MFTQPCFIQKNTLRLRNELEKLGYQLYSAYPQGADCIYCWGCYYRPHLIGTWYAKKISAKMKLGIDVIDCGDNEELFLALASLCDDRDIYQKYAIDEDGEYYPDYEETSDAYPEFFSKGDIVDFDDGALVHCKHHKATVEELIQHYGLP